MFRNLVPRSAPILATCSLYFEMCFFAFIEHIHSCHALGQVIEQGSLLSVFLGCLSSTSTISIFQGRFTFFEKFPLE